MKDYSGCEAVTNDCYCINCLLDLVATRPEMGELRLPDGRRVLDIMMKIYDDLDMPGTVLGAPEEKLQAYTERLQEDLTPETFALGKIADGRTVQEFAQDVRLERRRTTFN